MSSFFAGASKELLKNMFLEDGTLYISEAWKGEAEVISFIGLAHKRGVKGVEYLPAGEFQNRYVKAAKEQDIQGLGDSELQSYAKKLFELAFKENASDIHIEDYGTYGIIRFRCLGMLHTHLELPGEKTKQLIAVIYGTLAQQASTTAHTPTVRQDARIAKREYLPAKVHSIRVHTEPLEVSQADGGAGCFMSLRLLYDRTSAKGSLRNRLASLGYEDTDIGRFRFLTERSGLTIIAGPTGHGKSTLLKHVMEAQAEEAPEKSFQSVEDPPEYPLAGVKQVMVSTGNVADPAARGRNYIDAIAGAMRSDPDVLMIGEIRFPEAAVAAIDAALTGHGVWATLHANNALGIIMRMVSLLNAAHYADPLEYLCDHNVLAGLVYQRLVPALCPHCKIKLMDIQQAGEEGLAYRRKVLPDYVFKRLERAVNNPENVHIRGKGCPHCNNFGFAGQTIAAEVIVTDHTLLKHVRNGSISNAYQHWRENMKGRTVIQDAIQKIERGILDPHMTEIRLGIPLNFDYTDLQFNLEEPEKEESEQEELELAHGF